MIKFSNKTINYKRFKTNDLDIEMCILLSRQN